MTDETRNAESAQLLTVSRALQVLLAFRYDEPVLGVSELSRRLGIGKSSVHRILSTLVEHGFVTRTPDDRYRLGLRLHELGQVAVSSLRLREMAHPVLERLRNETGESVHLAIMEGTDVVYLDRFESPSMLKMFSRLGHRIEAHATSSGKCMMAFGPPELTDIVIAAGLKRLAPRSLTSEAALRSALAQVRSDGFAISIDERAPGVTSLGAPVFGHDGSCVAAVSVVGPTLRMPRETLPSLARKVRSCALEISRAVGFNVQRKPAAPPA